MSDDDIFREMAGARQDQALGIDEAAPPARQVTMDLEFPPEPFPDDFDINAYPFRGELLDRQVRALAEANLKPGHCCFMDPGGGKTGFIIAESSALYEMGKIDGVIALAPNGPHEQIIDEQFPEWCSVPWRGFHNKQRKRAIDGFFARANLDVMGVMAMNYDSLIQRSGRALIDRFIERFPRFYMVYDESSKLKSHTARRTTESTLLGRRAAYRRLLTGTPILKGPEDLYTQYDIAEPGITGHRRFTSFRSYFCITQPIPGARSRFAQKIVGYRNQSELKRRIAPYTTRIKSSEFRESANSLFMRVPTPMSREQAGAYRTMRDDLLADVSGEFITVENALSRMAKLLQIASGYILDAEGNVQWLGDNKVNAVNDLVDELDEPIVMFAPFIALQDALEEALRARKDRPVTRYRGREDVLRWKRDGGVILGNQSSGLGIGQNLQVAAATIYPANTFSAEARWQSVYRTDRTGQTRQCRFWDMVTPDTIEGGVLTALAAKEELANQTIDDIRRFLR